MTTPERRPGDKTVTIAPFCGWRGPEDAPDPREGPLLGGTLPGLRLRDEPRPHAQFN